MALDDSCRDAGVVSKMCSNGVQNVQNVNGEWLMVNSENKGKMALDDSCRDAGVVSRMCSNRVQNGFGVVPSVSDGGSKSSLSERGRYTGTACPK